MNANVSPPWLSVVIPSYHGERWIHAALTSLAADAAPGIEVLLIDGGPTRATLDAAAHFAERLTLRVFERPDLKSWHEKTNYGVEIAASQHVCWLGVDDVWMPGRARAVHAWIDRFPEVALQLGASFIIDRSGRRLGRWRCPLPSEVALAGDFVRERLLVQNFVAAPAPVFRKDAWLACGGLDPHLWYTADWDMWLKLTAAGPVHYHDEPTIGFRIHGGSLTMTGGADIGEFVDQMRRVLDRHLPRLGKSAPGVRAAAVASIEVNAALSLASVGQYAALMPALWSVLRLGPAGIARYLSHSRLMERLLPRLRAKWAGDFA